MSKAQPKSHPWHESISGTRHSPETVARVIAALAHASQSEVAAAVGLSRNAVCGLVHRARLAGAVVTFKMGRTPSVVAPIERIAHVPTPKPTPKPPRLPRPAICSVVAPVAPSAVAIMPTAVHATGVTILSVRTGQCRALDDARHCCCLPTVTGSSWCAGHRAMYVRSTIVRRAA